MNDVKKHNSSIGTGLPVGTSTTTNTPARLMAARKEANNLGVWLSKRPTKTPASRRGRIIHAKPTEIRSPWTNHVLTPALKKTLPKEEVFFIERLTSLMKSHPAYQNTNKFTKRFNFRDYCAIHILCLLNQDKKPSESFTATN